MNADTPDVAQRDGDVSADDGGYGADADSPQHLDECRRFPTGWLCEVACLVPAPGDTPPGGNR